MPMKNPVVSSSFAVAVHSMLEPTKWLRRALVRWKEIPEKKRIMRGVQVMI
jgi:hypothetical protein